MAKEKSKVEVVNDFNGTLVALYRNIQWHLPALLSEIRWIQNSRRNLYDFLTQPGLTELQTVARWFVLNRLSFAGNGKTYGVNRTCEAGTNWTRKSLLRKLARFRKRMETVSVENLDYRRFIDLYDSPATFFFLDPPYVDARPETYQGWDREQMTDFRDRVMKIKGSWIVTIDDSEFNRELFAGCQIEAVATRNGCGNQRFNPYRSFGEIIIRPAGQLPRTAE